MHASGALKLLKTPTRFPDEPIILNQFLKGSGAGSPGVARLRRCAASPVVPERGMSVSQHSPQAFSSPSTRARIAVPLVVAGLVGAIVVLLGLAVLGDIITASISAPTHSPWTWLRLGAASLILVLVGILGIVLRRKFAQLRALSDDLRREEEKFRLYGELGSDWFWETDAQHRFVVAGRR